MKRGWSEFARRKDSYGFDECLTWWDILEGYFWCFSFTVDVGWWWCHHFLPVPRLTDRLLGQVIVYDLDWQPLTSRSADFEGRCCSFEWQEEHRFFVYLRFAEVSLLLGKWPCVLFRYVAQENDFFRSWSAEVWAWLDRCANYFVIFWWRKRNFLRVQFTFYVYLV